MLYNITHKSYNIFLQFMELNALPYLIHFIILGVPELRDCVREYESTIKLWHLN